MSDLLAVVDEVNHARRLIECAWIASQALEPEDAEPLAAVLDLASDKLVEIATTVGDLMKRNDRLLDRKARS